MSESNKTAPIEVLLVKEEAMIRLLIKKWLEVTREIKVTGETEDGESAVQLVKQHHPSVVIFDVNVVGIGAIEAVRLMQRVDSSVRVLVLGPNVDRNIPLRLLESGVDGYLTTSSSPHDLLEAVRQVHGGEKWLDPRVATNIVLDKVYGRTSPLDDLSPRELEVMTWIAKGKKLSDISEVLSRSPKTISTLRSRILRKLRVETDVDLTLIALRHRVVRMRFHF